MKKKNILTIGIIAVILASILIAIVAINQTNSNINNISLKTYIYEPVSIVDNKIKSEDAYILPFIFKTTDDRLNESYLNEEFAKANLSIQSLSSDNLGTGTTIKLNEDDTTYQILIYGDVNGDGKIGLADAQKIVDYYLDAEKQPLTDIYYTAANVSNNNTKVDLMDAQRIIDFYLNNVTTILLNPPADDVITGIEVIAPNKVVYNYGEELDLTGAQVRRVTASGAKCILEDLPENCVTGYDKTKAGEQELTVQYEGYTSTITVRVLEYDPTSRIDKIEIDRNLQIICKENLDGVTIPSERIYTETKKVEDKMETIYYTLLPVKFIDQYGEYVALNATDFAGYEEATANKLTINDNYGFEIPGLEVKIFRKNADGDIVIAGGENTFDYIGFASIHNVEADTLDGGTVTITYCPNEFISVQANIQVNVIK